MARKKSLLFELDIDIDIPPMLATQEEDAEYLSHNRHGALFSEPGTGKTLTVLRGMEKAGFGTEKDDKAVIVGPPISIRMWARWSKAYFEQLYNTIMPVQILVKGSDQIDPRAKIVIVSYGLLSQTAVVSKLNKFAARFVVADESDALKNRTSKRALAIWGRGGKRLGTIREHAEYVWPLTGTPIRRYPDDLFAHFKALHPKVLRDYNVETYEKFSRQFCIVQMRSYHPRQPMTPTVIGARNTEQLSRMIKDNYLAVRRTIHDVAKKMPPLSERIVDINYERSQELEDACAGVALEMVDLDDQDRASNSSLATAKRLLGIAKVNDAWSYIKEVLDKEGGPILVFFWHREVGDKLSELAAADDLKALKLDGASNAKAKVAAEQAFNAKQIDLLFGQIQTMGVSLNLQAGSHRAIAVESDWSEAAMDQAKRRLWRLGQNTHVLMDYLVAEHFIDTANMNTINKKRWVIEKVMD